ncbi:misexpression suppressor of ras 4 isoform X2 [Cotesia typhae]|uniref:misexpression suppressor of ras 4 isoform X2 n=1 Tax=Cotesia typhae TaxID=2053667 RepID=UPI003D6974B2
MDDEDGEASNNDSWTPEQLSYKETPLPDDFSRLNPENKCEIDSEERQVPRGSKNNYFPDNKVSFDSGKSKDVTEYAQCLGLQPAAANSTPGPSDHQHESSKRCYKSSSSVKNNFRITRKVYLCSACGTYFENWNLFLHMRETHKRHICLFCLGMFGQAERLSNHLIKKHSVQVENFNNIDNFYDIFKGSCYLLCCDCEKVFSETDNFSEHNCLSVNVSELKEVQSVVDQPETVSQSHHQQQQQQQQPQQPAIINEPVNLPAKLGSSQERHERINNKRTLLPNPANKVAKKLLSEKAKLKNDFYQTKLANLYSRKQRCEEKEEEEEEQEDIEGDYSVNNYFKNSEVSDKTRITEVDITNSPEKSDRYTDTIMQVSRCSDDWDSVDDKEDTVNSLDEMEQGELILDDGKEDSVESLPSPIREVSPILSPREQEKAETEKGETTTETSATTEESPVKEPAATCTRVNSSNRSLVIKICTNKNSQFSIATPNSNGTYTESGDEAKDSDKENDSDSASDSDTGKLTVALPEPEGQKSPELEQEQEAELETKETEPPEEPPEVLNESQEDKNVDENQQNDNDAVQENQLVPDDGILVASSDAPSIDLNVVGLLESMEIDELLKLCIEAASPTCVYCNHARHIAINGKQLALHMLAEHKFQPQHPAIIIQREQFTNRVKKSLDELEAFYFNFDSYDSKRGTYAFPEVRTYECYLCRIYFTIHKDLYLHNRKSHQKTILVCIMCKSSFFNHSELLCHLCPGVYAAGGTLRYRCCMCSIESLPSSFRLMVHLRKRHDTCDVCLESTGNQQKLSNHVWKHKLHHLCYRCGIAYRNKPDITKHLFWKHGTESVVCKKCLQKKWPHVYHFCIPPSEFICEECGANFTRAVALKVHKRLHTGDAPYGCSECSEKFISKKLAAKHEESHKQPEIPPAPDPEPEKEKACENKQLEEVEVPKEQPVRKVVDVYDLPPLNLSSDSDSSEDERVLSKDKSKEDDEEDKEKVDEENKEIDEARIEINEVPEEIQLSEANDEADEVNKQEVVIMNGIWDNFKSYAASLGSDLTPEVELKASNDEILKNIAAEHDYWVVYEPPKDEIQEEREPVLEDKKKKSPKKKKSGSDSSSDSSSDSDSSSCSCGTNCSCSSSSSGSSSSSSSSSDSDSSTESHKQSRKDRRKEREAKRKKEDQVPPERENGICEEVNEENNAGTNLEVQDPPREALPVRESDLETTETETDEDFYDGNPQQHASRLAERRSQSAMQEPVPPGGAEVKNGVIEPVESQVNSLPVKSKPSLKRKIKTKRRKKLETREARESVRGRGRGRPPGSTKGTLKLNIPKNILFQKKNPSPPTFNTIDEFMYTNYQVTDSTFNSSAMSATSENEASANDSKRSSKRKRIPKKFYGDSSDEEHQRNATKWQRPNTTVPYVPSITIKQNFGPPPPVNKVYSQEPALQPAVITQPVETPAPVSVHAAVNVTTDSEPADSSSDSSSEEETNANTRATHPPINNLNAIGSTNVYCYCRCPYDEVSEMIACDGNNCRIEWFHFECVGIMVPPKGKWYCPDCLKRDQGLAADDDHQLDQ